MSNFSFGASFAVAVILWLTSCKTVREVTHVESKGASDPLTERFIGGSVSKYESGARHPMDRKRTTTKKLFGGTQNNLMFSDTYDKKIFQSSKKNSLNDNQFNPGNYYFAQKRSLTRERSFLSDDQFLLNQKKANQSSKKWIGRNRSVRKTGFLGSKKTIGRKPFREASAAQELNRKTDLNIISSPGSQRTPEGMSIEDVRKLLGN